MMSKITDVNFGSLQVAEYKILDWLFEDNKLFGILFPRIRDAALAGAETALEGTLEMGIGVDWGIVNEAVVEWARSHTFSLVKGVNGTTRNFLRSALPEWIQSGLEIDDLIKDIAPMFGKVRAEMISVTEVTGAFSQGNIITWKESGVVSGKRWMTAVDELVCPICQPLHKMVVELDGNGFTTEPGGLGLEAPPAHVRCRCYLQPFVEKP